MRAIFRFAIVLTVGFLALPAVAQNTGLAFLKIGTDARGMAMGSAATATIEGPFSTYWNPAGLAGSSSNTAALTHHVWISDVRIYSLAGGLAAGKNGAFGLSLTAVGSGDIAVRSGPGDPEGFFSAQFVSTGISYGRSFGALSIGITGKYLVERIFNASAAGFGVDAGMQYGMRHDEVSVGIAVQHLGRMSRLGEVASDLPQTVKAGLGLRPFDVLTRDDQQPFLDTQVTIELVRFLEEEENQIRAGLEARMLEIILARAGWRSNNELFRFSLGAGIELETLRFDYAFLAFRSGFGGGGHVLTLIYGW